MPDWEGTVTLGGAADARGRAKGGRSSSSEGESDFDEAMLALDDVQVGYELRRHGRRADAESQQNLVRGDADDSSEYSTSVLRRGSHLDSNITVKAFDPNEDGRQHGRQHGHHHHHHRLASTTSSLPSLPDLWIRQASEADDASLPITPALDAGKFPDPPKYDTAGASFLTARTTSLSIAGATISHGGSDDEAEADERDDVFHSMILSPLSPPLPALHRFSLIKPGFQRFLGSFAPYATPSTVTPPEANSKRSSIDGGKRPSVDGGKRGSVGEDGIFGVSTKCQLCDKRLGILKPFLQCDDCHYKCHIKCSVSFFPAFV